MPVSRQICCGADARRAAGTDKALACSTASDPPPGGAVGRKVRLTSPTGGGAPGDAVAHAMTQTLDRARHPAVQGDRQQDGQDDGQHGRRGLAMHTDARQHDVQRADHQHVPDIDRVAPFADLPVPSRALLEHEGGRQQGEEPRHQQRRFQDVAAGQPRIEQREDSDRRDCRGRNPAVPVRCDCERLPAMISSPCRRYPLSRDTRSQAAGIISGRTEVDLLQRFIHRESPTTYGMKPSRGRNQVARKLVGMCAHRCQWKADETARQLVSALRGGGWHQNVNIVIVWPVLHRARDDPR